VGHGPIELSELVAHVQSAVPKVAAEVRRSGHAATVEPVFGQPAARFGSRGEDFTVARRLHSAASTRDGNLGHARDRWMWRSAAVSVEVGLRRSVMRR
jgi:hypothetical protein